MKDSNLNAGIKLTILLGLLAILPTQSSLAQTDAEKDVLQFERDACQAFLDADPAALERVLTADFTLTLSNGEVSTRADEINDLRKRKSALRCIRELRHESAALRR